MYKKVHESIRAEPDAKSRKLFAGKTKRLKPCTRRRMNPSGPNPTPSLGRSLLARPRDGTVPSSPCSSARTASGRRRNPSSTPTNLTTKSSTAHPPPHMLQSQVLHSQNEQ